MVIGDELAMEIATRLREFELKIEVLLMTGGVEPGESVVPAGGRDVVVSGYMGEFKIALGEQGAATYEELRCDLILDLNKEPLLKMAIKPAGYLVADPADELSVLEALEQLKNLKGTFEKPHFLIMTQVFVHMQDLVAVVAQRV